MDVKTETLLMGQDPTSFKVLAINLQIKVPVSEASRILDFWGGVKSLGTKCR